MQIALKNPIQNLYKDTSDSHLMRIIALFCFKINFVVFFIIMFAIFSCWKGKSCLFRSSFGNLVGTFLTYQKHYSDHYWQSLDA